MAARVSSRLTEGIATHADVAQKPTERPTYREFVERYLVHHTRNSWSRMHESFADEFNTFHLTRGRRECIVAPRGGAKTTHWSNLYPLYCIAYELESYILLLAATTGQAEQNLGIIKEELEGNLALRRDFPSICGPGRIWRANRIITRNGIGVQAVGRGKRVRGAKHGHHRPGLIIGDDIEDLDSVETQSQRDKNWKWLTNTIIPLGIEKQVNIAIVGTVLNPDDTTQRIAKTPGWSYRKYPAVVAWPKRMDLWQRWAEIFKEQTIDKNEGRLAKTADPALAFFQQYEKAMKLGSIVQWEAQESIYDLMVFIQRNGRKAFESEKQGSAIKSERTEWSPDLFGPKVRFKAFPQIRHRCMVCDPSKGKGEKSDFSAFVWGGVDAHGVLFVDADIQRRDVEMICRDGVAIATMFKPVAIGVEEDNYGALGALWKRRAADVGAVLPETHLIRNRTAKEVLIRRLTSWFHRGLIRFRDESPGCAILIQQLIDFPFDKHDDGPDALQMFVRLIQHLIAEEASAGSPQEPGEVVFEVNVMDV